MANTKKHFVFFISVSGEGDSLQEAWNNCVEEIQTDGLSSEPPGLNSTNLEHSILDWEECEVCGAGDLPPGTNTHCD